MIGAIKRLLFQDWHQQFTGLILVSLRKGNKSQTLKETSKFPNQAKMTEGYYIYRIKLCHRRDIKFINLQFIFFNQLHAAKEFYFPATTIIG